MRRMKEVNQTNRKLNSRKVKKYWEVRRKTKRRKTTQKY